MRYQFVGTRCLARDKQFIALSQFCHGFQRKLRHGDVFEIVGAFAGIYFLARGLAAVVVRPLA